MKKLVKVLGIAVLVLAFATSLAFAGELELNATYPENGSKGAPIENFGLKLEFNEPVSKADASLFELKDENGTVLPVKVLCSEKKDGIVLVLFDKDSLDKESDIKVLGNTKYTLTVKGGLVSDNGDELAEDKAVTFTTVDQKKNGLINTLIMIVMFGGIFLFSSLGGGKKEEKAKEAAKAKVNPYKEAKKTGKSIDEIIERDKAIKAKQAMKDAKAEEELKAAIEKYGYLYSDNYRVKGPRPISQAGGKYITGRKALAEKKAQEKAEALLKEEKYKASKGKKKK